MRILIIADEIWNDKVHGNNVLTNWFSGFPAEIYAICCNSGKMENNVCKNYYQITDKMMFKSFFSKRKAGKIVKYSSYPHEESGQSNLPNSKKRKFTGCVKKCVSNEFMRNMREYLWLHGKYDEKGLINFLDEANPDVIFSARKASAKILRLEQFVKSYTNKPIVVYTGDNECGVGENLKGLRKMRLNRISKIMDKQIPTYNLYYTHSVLQAKEYSDKYFIPTKVIQKCGEFRKELVHVNVNHPIKIVYAGKLYCNRWKTLIKITEVLKEINKTEKKIVLEIYTKDDLPKKKKQILNDGQNCFFKGAVPPKDLINIYKQSDIVLHVESFDKHYKAITKYSFSTKIIDCIASGCAVMAICSPEQEGFSYLRKNDAAITIDSMNNIYNKLNEIAENPEIITEYAYKAYVCGNKNHEKVKVQNEIYETFETIIARSKGEKNESCKN